MTEHTIATTPTWHPTAEEVESILVEMRPLIDRFADRDLRQLAQWANAA
jgi:hypothetical protein